MTTRAKTLKAIALAAHANHPVIQFAQKHDACDFTYEYFFDKEPADIGEMWLTGDARIVMFMFFKACPPNAEPFLNFSKRLVAFLIEHGEHSVAAHVAGRIGEAEALAHTCVEWNKSLIAEMTIADRRAAHEQTLQRLGVTITRRLAYYVMDIVHQTFAGKFDLNLSYYLAEFFRNAVGDTNPFVNASEKG